MGVGMCLIALNMLLLKWKLLWGSMRFILYYWNESMYVSEFALYDIFNLGVVCLWMRFMCYYWNERL